MVPFSFNSSVYVTVTVSPACVLKTPSSSVPASVPKVVSTVPANTPVSGPVSVKVIVSSSPVMSFTTTTSMVSTIASSTFKSISVTVISRVSPGIEKSVISTNAVSLKVNVNTAAFPSAFVAPSMAAIFALNPLNASC